MKKKFLNLLLALSISALFFGCSSKNTAINDGNMPGETQTTPSEDNSQVTPEETPIIPDTARSNDGTNPNTEAPKVVEETPDKENTNPTPPPNTPPASTTTPQTPKTVPQEEPKNVEKPNIPQTPQSPPNSALPPVVEDTSTNYLPAVEQEIFNMVNQERQKAGVPPLSYNKTMEKYARIKSKDMGDRNYFAHENPEGQLITAQMKKDGVSYNAWGENIAYTGGSPSGAAKTIMNMWMNSDGHRKNILSPNFIGIGVGVTSHNGKIYATQEFYR